MQAIIQDWIIPDLANIISEYLEETKILVVGEQGCGKTALLLFLQGVNFSPY